jgi:hypothetical protein
MNDIRCTDEYLQGMLDRMDWHWNLWGKNQVPEHAKALALDVFIDGVVFASPPLFFNSKQLKTIFDAAKSKREGYVHPSTDERREEIPFSFYSDRGSKENPRIISPQVGPQKS